MKDTEEKELDVDIEDIGTILKSSRLKSKKTLEEISNELCIRKIYLTALEEGDYETLPPIPYGMGYVRTYAKFLGLSPERAVKLYKKAAQVEEQEKIEEVAPEPEVSKSSRWHIILGIIALIIIYGLWNMYVANKNAKIIEAQIENTELVNEATIQDSTDTIDNEVVFDESSEIEEDKKTENKQEEASKEEPNDKESLKNKVVLSFSGETWVELKDRKKIYIQGVFHKGDVKEIDYTDNMFLSVGRPRNVVVSVRGEEKNILIKKRKSNIPLDSL